LAVSAYLINGTFRVTGGVPSGDSARFHPDDPQAFTQLGWAARTNSAGGARLRLAGIDALETAYVPPGAITRWHQPAELAQAGAAALTSALGFDTVTGDGDGRTVSSSPSATPGHLLAVGTDSHGRVVGFAYPGRRRRPVTDLSRVDLDVGVLRDSVNWMLLRQGLAYPVPFARLHPSSRAELVAAAAHARGQRRGVWPHDVTVTGFQLADRDQLQDDVVVLPLLFRRLADYLELEGAGTGAVNLAGFRRYLAACDDRVLVLPQGELTGLASVVEVEQQQVRLSVPLESLVFFER
jgi:endonuclease YncB( thermonuclease family)